MVLGPLLLEMGLIPEISTATSSFLVLFTSSSTTTQFFLLGMLKLNFTVYFWFISMFASFIGLFLLRKIVQFY